MKILGKSMVESGGTGGRKGEETVIGKIEWENIDFKNKTKQKTTEVSHPTAIISCWGLFIAAWPTYIQESK